MVSRRTILRAGVLAPVLTGCASRVSSSGGSTAVRIAVPWSGDELRAFRKVLDGLPRAAPGADAAIEVVPLGDEIDTALSARRSSAPEIVMLPTVGEVRSQPIGRLKSVPVSLWSTDGQNHVDDDERLNYTRPWRKLLWPRGEPHAVPFKSAAKSLLWYDRTAFAGGALPPGWTVADWSARVAPGRALLALGAADGWVLADMFENVLDSWSPEEYRILQDASWAGDPRNWDTELMKDIFTRLGSLWGAPGVLPGGVGRALTLQFPDAVRAVFEHRKAAMVAAPDFAAPIVRSAMARARRPEHEVGVTWFPAVAPDKAAPRIGGGDVMVMTANASTAAVDLVTRLSAPNATASWVENPGGFLVPRRGSEPLPDWPILTDLAPDLNKWDAFGLADMMGPAGRRNGLWQVLTDLLKDVGTGRHPEEAAHRAVDGMVAVEKSFR
ncbi:hypothetical protein [Nocardia sp. BMG111209]|uniref:hypothetical protein n=1 Tax=Nocardia sp. BMG111209 TaxID=1160137 RepID=UPI00037548FC|nr:hypothetical protein [Nocardia sp. BMG111209]